MRVRVRVRETHTNGEKSSTKQREKDRPPTWPFRQGFGESLRQCAGTRLCRGPDRQMEGRTDGERPAFHLCSCPPGPLVSRPQRLSGWHCHLCFHLANLGDTHTPHINTYTPDCTHTHIQYTHTHTHRHTHAVLHFKDGFCKCDSHSLPNLNT